MCSKKHLALILKFLVRIISYCIERAYSLFITVIINKVSYAQIPFALFCLPTFLNLKVLREISIISSCKIPEEFKILLFIFEIDAKHFRCALVYINAFIIRIKEEQGLVHIICDPAEKYSLYEERHISE